MRYEEFKEGIQDGIPICLGYISVSVAFGMTAVLSGIPVWAAVLISLTNVTSAGQFAGTNLLVAQGTYLELALTTLIINIRYFLMSLSVSQRVEQRMGIGKRLVVAFGITDEIFAVSMQRKKRLSAPYMAGLILTPVLGWTGGTLIGATATSLMPPILSAALGIALYGMFIAIIIPPARIHKSVLYAVVLAVVLSCIFYWVPGLKKLSGGWSIIIITVAVSALMAWKFPVSPEDEEDE